MKCKQLIFTGFFTLIIANTINAQKKPHLDKSKPIEERIDLLIQQITIYEKVGQMNQYNGFWEALGPAPKGGYRIKIQTFTRRLGRFDAYGSWREKSKIGI